MREIQNPDYEPPQNPSQGTPSRSRRNKKKAECEILDEYVTEYRLVEINNIHKPLAPLNDQADNSNHNNHGNGLSNAHQADNDDDDIDMGDISVETINAAHDPSNENEDEAEAEIPMRMSEDPPNDSERNSSPNVDEDVQESEAKHDELNETELERSSVANTNSRIRRISELDPNHNNGDIRRQRRRHIPEDIPIKHHLLSAYLFFCYLEHCIACKQTIEYAVYASTIHNTRNDQVIQQTKSKFNQIINKIEENVQTLAGIMDNVHAISHLLEQGTRGLDLEFLKSQYIVFINKTLIGLATSPQQDVIARLKSFEQQQQEHNELVTDQLRSLVGPHDASEYDIKEDKYGIFTVKIGSHATLRSFVDNEGQYLLSLVHKNEMTKEDRAHHEGWQWEEIDWDNLPQDSDSDWDYVLYCYCCKLHGKNHHGWRLQESDLDNPDYFNRRFKMKLWNHPKAAIQHDKCAKNYLQFLLKGKSCLQIKCEKK
eukprot:23174_1